MSPEFLYWLQVFALIFFNIICIFGIVLVVSIWRTNIIVRKQLIKLGVQIEEQVNTFSMKSYNLMSDVTDLVLSKFSKKTSNFMSDAGEFVLSKFFKRR